MPFYMTDLDVLPEIQGTRSALIVACYMCPAMTIAAKQKRPFIRLSTRLARSEPFEEHMEALQARLREGGVDSELYRSAFYCMWPSGRRKKLAKRAARHDAVIVLACDSATETVHDSVTGTGCRVVRGMEVAGITNARMRFRLPFAISLEDGRLTPISQTKVPHEIPDPGISDLLGPRAR